MPGDNRKALLHLHHGNVSEVYNSWPAPDVIISDGAYGVRGFRGDTENAEGLAEWYQPHALAWAKAAKPSTSLWFWNTEIGWATVHPLLNFPISKWQPVSITAAKSRKKKEALTIKRGRNLQNPIC